MYVPAADEFLITKVYPLAYDSPDDPKLFPHYLPLIEKENGVGRVNISSPMPWREDRSYLHIGVRSQAMVMQWLQDRCSF